MNQMQQSLQTANDRLWIGRRPERQSAAAAVAAPSTGGFFRGLTVGLAMMVPIWGLAIWLMMRLFGSA